MTGQMTVETAISNLYHNLLDAWNNRDAHAYALLFAEDANVTGYDGSQMNGRSEIETELSRIFADHTPATYISKVREVRLLSPEISLLRAVVGMIPPGKSELNPERNAIQSLVAIKRGSDWKIVQFQNTPARFDGRPNLAEALTAELRALL